MKFKTNKGVAIAKQLLTKLGPKSKTMVVIAALLHLQMLAHKHQKHILHILKDTTLTSY